MLKRELRLRLSSVSEELRLFKGQARRGFDAPLGGVGGMTVAVMSQKQLAFWDMAALQDSVGNNRDPFSAGLEK